MPFSLFQLVQHGRSAFRGKEWRITLQVGLPISKEETPSIDQSRCSVLPLRHLLLVLPSQLDKDGPSTLQFPLLPGLDHYERAQSVRLSRLQQVGHLRIGKDFRLQKATKIVRPFLSKSFSPRGAEETGPDICTPNWNHRSQLIVVIVFVY